MGNSGTREPRSTFQALGWGGQKGENVTRKPCPSFFAKSKQWHNGSEVEGDFNPGLGKRRLFTTNSTVSVLLGWVVFVINEDYHPRFTDVFPCATHLNSAVD